MNQLSLKYLNVFTKRRATRLLGMVIIVIGFVVLQVLQTEDGSVVSQTATSTTQTSTTTTQAQTLPYFGTELFFKGSTTSSVEALVTRAVDGDTIEVKILSTNELVKVRLLGINTPESVDPRRPVQCFGKEASKRMKELVEGKTVLLVEDVKADDRDKYGRWLRNVVRKDDLLDVNATLLAQGYATAYLSFPLDGKRKAELRLIEQEAKINERGLWSPSTCEGKK